MSQYKFEKREKGKLWVWKRDDGKEITLEYDKLMNDLYKKVNMPHGYSLNCENYVVGLRGKYLQSCTNYSNVIPVLDFIQYHCFDYLFFNTSADNQKIYNTLKDLDTILSIYPHVRHIEHLEYPLNKVLKLYNKNHPQADTFDFTISMREYEQNEKDKFLCSLYGNYDKELINTIYEQGKIIGIWCNNSNNKAVIKQIKLMANNYEKISEFRQSLHSLHVLSGYEMTTSNTVNYILTLLSDYITSKTFFGEKIKPSDDLLEEVKYFHTYLSRKKLCEEDIILQQYQTERPLIYMDKQYNITVPTTKAQMIENGTYMHNCFGGFECEKVCQHQHYAVELRDNNTNEILVDISINTKTGRIQDFLGKYNNAVTDKQLLDFEEKYQTYLNTLWKGGDNE